MEYNEETCVTARALREVGVPIPAHVPDCAWVPRWSFRPEVVQGSARDDGQGRMSIGIAVRFDEPFRWVEGTFTVSKEVADAWDAQERAAWDRCVAHVKMAGRPGGLHCVGDCPRCGAALKYKLDGTVNSTDRMRVWCDTVGCISLDLEMEGA